MTLTVNDAVFDGVSLSMTMEVQHKADCGEGVYVTPRVTAECGGEALDVDIEGCFGDFYNGFWMPERDQGILYADGCYGADYAVVTESENGVVADPQQGPVTWTVSFDIIRPVYPVESAPAMFDAQGNETMPWTEWMQSFEDTYANGKILLADGYGLVEYDAELPKLQGMDEAEGQSMRLPERLIASGAFERVDRPEISFTTQDTQVRTLCEPQTFVFGDYQAKVTQLSVCFGRCDYEIEVTKTTQEGKTAGQEWVDGEGEWTFAVLAEGCKTSRSVSSTQLKNCDDETPCTELLCQGTVMLIGETDSVTFVPCRIEQGLRLEEYPDSAVYQAQSPTSAEQEEMMFTIHLR